MHDPGSAQRCISPIPLTIMNFPPATHGSINYIQSLRCFINRYPTDHYFIVLSLLSCNKVEQFQLLYFLSSVVIPYSCLTTITMLKTGLKLTASLLLFSQTCLAQSAGAC